MAEKKKQPSKTKTVTKAAAGKRTPSKKAAAGKKTPPKKTSSSKAGAKTASAAKKKTDAGKKTPSKAKRGGGPQKKSQGSGFRGWPLFWIIVLSSALLVLGYNYLQEKQKNRMARHKAPKTQEQPAVKVIKPQAVKSFSKPDFEIFPIEPETRKIPPPPPLPRITEKRPLVAIIIDDLGYEKAMADRFLSLEGPLTYAILPQSPFQREIAERAHRKGAQIMLHLPMEPREYPGVDPGPGALLSDMTPDERIRALKANLEAVPYITGVNNHMGSRMTANSAQMNQILSILKKRNLYFIDSRTTPDSLSKSSARLFQVPYAERDVFLDHDIDPESIRKQFDRLLRIAAKYGKAVGIGHPHAATYEVLQERLPLLKDRVKLVPASEIVSILGS